MPKQEGPNKMIGFIDGKIYYKMKGEYYVRNSSAPSKKRVRKSSTYKTFRNNSKEFGVASSIGSCFRKSFGSILESVSDKRAYTRISKLFANVIHAGQGEQGRRSVEILSNRGLFQEFQFKSGVNFNHVFKVPYSMKVSKDRKEIVFNVPSFKASSGIIKIPGVTHFKLILSVVAFSNYSFDNKEKEYLPEETSFNRLCVTEFSERILIRDKVAPISLISTLHIRNAVPDTIGLIACIGIEFYEETAGKFYLVEKMSCMKIAEVF